MILEYIRRNLPPDSADAYPRTELAQLNVQRTVHDRFDPYTTDRDAGAPR